MRLRVTEAEFEAMKKRVTYCKVGPDRPPVPSITTVACTRSPYRSKWEENFAAKLDLEQKAGIIKAWWYEPFSLWLPGNVRYKPDFLIEQRLPVDDHDRRVLEVVEVKGWSRNRRDGMTRLKIAAALFPCFVWRMVWMKKGGHFDGEYV
jgi:hypothetical protein